MTVQSIRPIFSDGVTTDGLMGLAFSELSVTSQEPTTVMDAWHQSGALLKNEIAFHGCPYSSSSKSWIDFGNDTPYSPCDDLSVTIGIPKASYFNLKVLEIAVSGAPVQLYSGWEKSMYSILDSCTSLILVPAGVVSKLQTDILNSGGLSYRLRSSLDLQDWLDGNVLLGFKQKDIDWKKLPNISFTISSAFTEGTYRNISLVLGPRQYIQIDTNGYCKHNHQLTI